MHITHNTRGGWSVNGVGNYPTRSDAERVARINDRLDRELSHGVRVDGGPPPWLPVVGLVLVTCSLAVLLYTITR